MYLLLTLLKLREPLVVSEFLCGMSTESCKKEIRSFIQNIKRFRQAHAKGKTVAEVSLKETVIMFCAYFLKDFFKIFPFLKIVAKVGRFSKKIKILKNNEIGSNFIHCIFHTLPIVIYKVRNL